MYRMTQQFTAGTPPYSEDFADVDQVKKAIAIWKAADGGKITVKNLNSGLDVTWNFISSITGTIIP